MLFRLSPAPALGAMIATVLPLSAHAKPKINDTPDCTGLPGQAALMAGLRLARQSTTPATLPMAAGATWIAVINRQGEVCAAASNDRDADAAGVPPPFEHGLPLYSGKGVFMGAISVAGAGSACANHLLAWRARAAYYLDYTPSSFPSSKAGPVRWSSNLSPSPCANQPGGLTALADLPPTRRNPALADQSQALREGP